MGCESEVAARMGRTLSPEESAFIKELCVFHRGEANLAHASLERHLEFASFKNGMIEAGALPSQLHGKAELILQWFLEGISARKAASRLRVDRSKGSASPPPAHASQLLGAIAQFESSDPTLAPLWLAWHAALGTKLKDATAFLHPPATASEETMAASLLALGTSVAQARAEIVDARRRDDDKSNPVLGDAGP